MVLLLIVLFGRYQEIVTFNAHAFVNTHALVVSVLLSLSLFLSLCVCVTFGPDSQTYKQVVRMHARRSKSCRARCGPRRISLRKEDRECYHGGH